MRKIFVCFAMLACIAMGFAATRTTSSDETLADAAAATATGENLDTAEGRYYGGYYGYGRPYYGGHYGGYGHRGYGYGHGFGHGYGYGGYGFYG